MRNIIAMSTHRIRNIVEFRSLGLAHIGLPWGASIARFCISDSRGEMLTSNTDD